MARRHIPEDENSKDLVGLAKKCLGDQAMIKEDRRYTQSLIIRGVDELSDTRDVEEAVKAVAENKGLEKEIKVNTLKQKSRTKVATITVPKDVANKLLQSNRGEIKIGWSRCTVQEIMIPKRCHKCKNHGHISKDCTGEYKDLRKTCKKCGEEGHFYKECRNDPACHECGQKERQTATMACPKYREIVKQMWQR